MRKVITPAGVCSVRGPRRLTAVAVGCLIDS